MSDDELPRGQSLMPSSSATFALTLDQNVSREVRRRIVRVERQARNARVVTTLGWGASAIGSAVLAVTEPITLLAVAYVAGFLLPVPTIVWWHRRKVAAAAVLLDQDRDVAFVGPDGLVFFSDEGFFIEKRGGWKPWGVAAPTPRRYDHVEHRRVSNELHISSSAGYGLSLRVPSGWTDVDTGRVREKLEAFSH